MKSALPEARRFGVFWRTPMCPYRHGPTAPLPQGKRRHNCRYDVRTSWNPRVQRNAGNFDIGFCRVNRIDIVDEPLSYCSCSVIDRHQVAETFISQIYMW